MTRRTIEDLTQSSSPPVESESGSMMSPPAPQASPAARSPMNRNLHQDAPSPPTMLATMTPVNIMDLKKDLDDKRNEEHNNATVYHVKTEMIYPQDKEDAQDIYSHTMTVKHHHQQHAPIDLIYEDGNKTVIYTTTPDQKGLEIYSSQSGGDVTINNINAHAHLTDVLMDGGDDADVAATGADSHTAPPGAVSVVLQTGAQGLLQYPQSQVPGTTVLVLSELVEDMSGVPVLGLR